MWTVSWRRLKGRKRETERGVLETDKSVKRERERKRGRSEREKDKRDGDGEY